jgi:DNA-binding NarL/FixJ family response regulator
MAREVILIVDDDPGLRELLSNVLRIAGYETREVADGQQALDLVKRESPSLVVLDINMPGMSGYTVCASLRRNFGNQLPIVFLSGARTEPYDRAGGLLIGADDYSVKPFDAEEIVARVRRLLLRARTHDRRQPAGEGETRWRPHELTPREFEVFGLLAHGLNQREMAERLALSQNTIATHLQRILAKLDVRSRAQAVALAARERLFDGRCDGGLGR